MSSADNNSACLGQEQYSHGKAHYRKPQTRGVFGILGSIA